jgi:predicted metalloendopeptidase
MNLHEFDKWANHDYLQKQIPDNQSSLSNFSDITDRNTKNLIKLFEKLDDSTLGNTLLKTLYNKKINFPHLSFKEQYDTCSKIISIIDEINNASTLIEKICILSKFSISLFFSYGIDDNPSDTLKKPYIIEISQASLSLSKDYYFDPKYERELNGLNNHRKELLTLLTNKFPLYFKFSNADIDKICNDVSTFEMNMAPFILSNVAQRDVESRINIYKLKEIDKAFPDINLLHDCFLEELDLSDDKSTHDVLYSSNLEHCENFHKTGSSDDFFHIGSGMTVCKDNIDYMKLDKDMKMKADNGVYYWHYVNSLSKKYKEDDTVKDQIDNYIKWKVINSFSGFINDEIRVFKFKFYGTFLNGQQSEKPDDERAVSYLADALPELVGKIFCDTYFNEEHLALMKKLVYYLIITYEYNFKNKCKWMTDKDSLSEALKKLEVLKLDDHQKIGFPKENTYMKKYKLLFNLLDESGFDISSISNMSLFDFEIITTKWQVQLEVIKYKRETKDLDKWEMCAYHTNAYYHPFRNEIVFPAGILQEPFFMFLSNAQLDDCGIDLRDEPFLSQLLSDRIRISKLDPKYKSLAFVSMASNFGSIGAIIGHEISHGFDDQGSKFDSNGKMRSWWSKKVSEEYNLLTDKIIEQYNKFTVELTIDDKTNTYHVNGKLTIGENIADLFGLRVALDAFYKYYNDTPSKKTLDESIMELLVSYANTWRYLELPKSTKNRLNNDVHAPPKFRIIGTLHNIKEYYSTFNEPGVESIIEIFS